MDGVDVKTGALEGGAERIRGGSTGEVHVWRTRLPSSPDVPGEFLQVLSGEEEARYARIRDAVVQIRQRAGRAMLRWILGQYLERPAREVAFVYSALGKPGLAPGQSDVAYAFSVAHSEDCALFAIGFGASVGVDVERVRPEFDWAGIAAEHLTPAEQASLHAGPEADRTARFFRLWTRKEACLKAVGIGLSQGLRVAEVGVREGGPEFEVAVRAPGSAATQLWHGRDLPTRPGFEAALVSDHALHRVSWIDWDAGAPWPRGHRPAG